MGTCPKNHGMFSLGLVLLIFCHTSYELPTPQTCPVYECSGSDSLLAFQPQKSYVYKFEASSENILSGATIPSPGGKLHLTATAELQAISPCQFGLSISNVQVVGSDSRKHSSLSGLEGKAVQFKLDDGTLTSEICADESDDINSLNLKRAVASLLQVSSDSTTQVTDVFGDCPVDVKTTAGSEGVKIVNTARDLNKCQRRENIVSNIPATSYIFDSDTQAVPLLKATAKMQQRVKGGILEAATTHEEYAYRPFSNQGSGAVVSVHTSLTLLQQSAKIAFKAPVQSQIASVVFEPPHGSGTEHSNVKTVTDTLTAACDSMPSEAGSESAHSVRRLIQLLRQTTKDDMLTVYGAVKAGAGFKNAKSAKKVYLDALLHTATGESVEVLSELIKRKEVEEPTLFYTSLTFTRHATLASIRGITGLLEQGNPPRELVLGAGSLVGHYFEQHGRQGNDDLEQLLTKIARPLNNCKPKGHEQENKVVTALKGLHNAHFIPNSVAEKIKDCATNKKASNRVRAAALDSMQGDPSNKKLKQVASDILKDEHEDSELRIKAYLMLVSCPCGEVANTVQTLLDSEKCNQVGSFISTHLRNLRASSNPEKVNARKYLTNIRIPTDKFSLDARKFSTNTELSYSLGQANAAASAESNVIFSQNSFVPRSTSLNVTTNLFGHSFNLFEVGLRAENLEHILESYFGPKGYFKTHSPNEVLKTGSDNVNTLAEKIKDRAKKAFRGRRSLSKSDVDKIDKMVQHSDEDNINLDMYLKLFGAELAFVSYYGDPSSVTPSALVDKLFDKIDTIISKAKAYDYSLKEHMVLFDSELVYPTATGFPLRLAASSTAALHVHLEGNFDIKSMINDPKNANLRFNFMPSAAVEVSGDLQLDFYAASAGLKHAATLHTSTGLDVTFKVLNGMGFDLNIGTPLNKQEIITAKSELFATSKDRGQVQVDTPLQFSPDSKRRDYHGCFEQLSPLIGLTFCGDLGFPYEGVPKKGPFFPLDGPAKLVVRVEKDDTSLSSYHLRALYNKEVPDQRSLEVTFSTPGSSMDRTVSFLFEGKSKPDYEVKLSLKSPFKNAAVAGKLVNNNQEHSMTGTLELDEDRYVARLGLQVTGDSATHAEYKPVLEYSIYKGGQVTSGSAAGQQVYLDGTITMDRNQDAKEFKYTFSKLTLTTNARKYELDGFVSHEPKSYGVDLTFKYDNMAQSVHVKANGKRGDGSYHTYIEAHTSQYPDLAFAVNYDLKHDLSQNMVENKLKVHHGQDLTSEVNCLTISQFFKRGDLSSKDFELTTKNLVSYPALELRVQFDLEATRKNFRYLLEGGMEQHRLSSELALKHSIPGPDGQQNPKDPGGYELVFKVGAAEQTIIVSSKRQIITTDTSKLNFEFEMLPKGHAFKITSDLTHRLVDRDIKLKLTSVLSITGHPNTYTLCTGMQHNLENCEAHVKLSKNDDVFYLVKGQVTRGDPSSGKFEILLKNYLEGTASFTHSKQNRDGTFKAELKSPKLDRRMVIDGTLKPGAKATGIDANVDILLDADKDPSKKIHFESNIDLNKDGRTFDSKSVLLLIKQRFSLALKGVTPNRSPTDTGVLVKFDSQLELPGGQKISSYYELSQLQPKDGNGVFTKIRFDDGKGAKVNYEGRYSRVAGFALPTYDVSAKLNLVAPGKKDLTLQFDAVNREVEAHQAIDYKFDATGSVLPHPIHSTVVVELVENPKYHLKANYGSKLSTDIEANLAYKDPVKKSAVLKCELTTDIEGYENIKSQSSFSSERLDNAFKMDHTYEVSVNNARKIHSTLTLNNKREEDHCSGDSTWTLFLGPDEQDPRVWTTVYDYRGPGPLKVTLDTPQKFSGSSILKQGSTEFGVLIKSERTGDGTRSGKLNLETRTPVQGYEVMQIDIDHKSEKGNKQMKSKINFNLNNKQHFEVEGKVDLSEINRSFAVNVQRQGSTNPIVKASLGYSRAVASELSGEFSIVAGETQPRSLAVSGTAKYPGGVDDFEVELSVDSATLKFDKVKVEVSNKPGGKGGRKIVVVAKSPEKTIFEGSTSYQRKEEGGAVIYEGQGSFQVDSESRTSTFRLFTKTLTIEKDTEAGFEVNLEADLTRNNGQKQTLNIENKLTDKTLRAFDKYCDESSKCSSAELSNQVKISDVNDINVQNKLLLDLQHLPGVPAIEVTGKFIRNKLEFEHQIAATLGKDGTKSTYIYKSFIKNYKAGVHLTLPQRTMAIDGALITPESSGKAKQSDSLRTYKLEVTAGLDLVRNPNQKLTLLSTMTRNKGKDGTIYTSDLKISHPSLGRDLSVKSKSLYGSGQVKMDSSLTLDVFAKKNQAVEITLKHENIPVNGGHNLTSFLSVVSKGQNLDTKITSHVIATKSEIGFGSFAVVTDSKLGSSESGILFSITLDKVLLLARAPTCELLRLEGECIRSKNEDTKAKFKVTALQTLTLEGENIGYRHAKYSAYNHNTPTQRIIYTGFMELEQKLEISAEHSTGGKKNKLFRLFVSFEPESFLKTENTVNGENLKIAVDKLQVAVKAAAERLSVLVADTTKDATTRATSSMENFKKAQFNFKPLLDHLKQEYKELQEELKTDTSVQEIVDLVKNMVSGIAQTMGKFLETLTVHMEKISAKIQTISGKISELISKLSPVLTEAAGKVSKAIATAFTSMLEIVTSLTAKVLTVLKENSEDIQKFFSLVVEFIKEQSKQFSSVLADVKKYIEEFVKNLVTKIKELPFVDNIKERYKEMYDNFLSRFEGVHHDIFDTLKDVIPNDEFRKFIEMVSDYIDKKIKKDTTVEDVVELEKISKQFLVTVKSLLSSFGTAAPPGLPAFNLEGLLKLATTPVSLEALQSLPKWFNLRLSIVDLLSSEDLPSAADLLATYSTPRHLDDVFPPHKAYGQISGSQHFYTFDGSHYTLKGDCQYLLARDFDDGNFSLSVDLAGGKLQSVSLMDRQDTVDLRADHTVLLNGQAVELPLHHNDMALFRTLHSVHIKNKAGVVIVCDLHHDLCSFAVDGYYFGKTRGLLGTITNEKCDDMALPNGKVATTVQQFANAYTLSDSCKKQTPVEHKHTSHKECAYAFSSQQSLSVCFPFVDPTPYRQACDDAKDDATTPEDTVKAICEASAAYVTKCRYATFLRPNLPANCAKCNLGGKNVEIGGTASVKTPQGKADIVILVEQVAENEEAFTGFLSPVTTTLINDLQSKGIRDTRVSLIGYGGPGQKWPALFTTNGKFAFDGKTRPAQLKFGAKSADTPANKQHPVLEFLDRARNWATVESGMTPLAQAFQQVLQYPFRADAAKAVILLRHSPCQKSFSPISLQMLTISYAREFFRDRGIVVAFAQPVDIAVAASGDKKLIGFDNNNALTYSKKPVDPALRSDLDYSSDSCAPFIDMVEPTVFSMKNFKEIKANQRKQFVTSSSSRLSTLLTSSDWTQSCECRLHGGLHTEERCSVTAKSASQKKAAKS